MNTKINRTPSVVHIHEVQGVGNAELPTATFLPAIWHPAVLSLHADKSICGKEWHGTLGFLKF